MTSHNSPGRRQGMGRTLGLGLGLTLALLANLGDRAFSASTANSGIDPLQVLDVAVKNNILFVVGQSASMAGTVEQPNDVVGGDDPASRFYQVKKAVREVITANAGKANFGLASFQPEPDEHQIDRTKSLVYVTQDPSGENYRNNFTVSGGSSIAITLGSAATCTGAAANCTTGAFTPTANSLLVVFATSTGATTDDTTSVTGHGLTYSKVTSGTLSTDNHHMSVWVAKAGATPTSVGTTMFSSGRPQTVVEYVVTGADVSGLPVNAIAQTVTSNSTTAGTTASTTLAAASNTANAVMYFVVHNTATATVPSPGPGWIEGSDTIAAHSQGPNAAGVETQYNLAFSTAASATFPSSLWRGIALEIKTAVPPALIDSCVGVLCTPTESSIIFDLLKSNDAGTTNRYPSPAQLATCPVIADQVAVVAGVPVTNPPITHTLNTNCRYYIKSRVLLNGKRYNVSRGAAAGAAITRSQNITCPPPPPGLLGDDVLAAANGSQNRACFQLQDAASNALTNYWLTGTKFEYVNVNPTNGSTLACNQPSTPIVGVADCGVDNSTPLKNQMRMELQYDPITGSPLGIVPLRYMEAQGAPPTVTNAGIRLGNEKPLANSMAAALAYFQNTILTSGGTAQRPIALQGKQRQFVVLITDGDENCSGDAVQAAYNLWSNTAPGLVALSAAQLAERGITAAQYAAANRIELVLVSFAGGTASLANAIAEAGSGKNPATATCEAGAPCRSASLASSSADLVNALNNAIGLSSTTGEFSDQQSVTETVFEYANLATVPEDPLDPEDRYSVSVPILMQSTFELPGFKGHLNAFRRSDNGTPSDLSDDRPVQVWDAGQKLYDRVSHATLGMTTTTAYPFATLYGDATPAGATAVLNSSAKIKRRIYTTTQNGVNPSYTPSNLLNLNVTSLTAGTRVSLWPPTIGTATNTAVAPTTTGTTAAPIAGLLDTAMGFDALTTVAQVQALVPGACQGTGLHADCTSQPLPRAKREAREIILAFIAGAQVKTSGGFPVRVSSEIQYEVRPWILVESTLAAPGVVTPPLLAGPTAAVGAVGVEEYKHYRDGLKQASGAPVADQIIRGIGLRNPDRVATTASAAVKDAAANDPNLKPVMSVVYHATNQGLHALRAGPCPEASASSGLFATTFGCDSGIGTGTDADGDGDLDGETGGEELWSFIPFDQLGKLPALITPQTRGNKQYLLASPVRFSDVFVPGSASVSGAVGGSFTGVWRTLLFFGRGQGGKHYTALDITAPGAFTKHSLQTEPPIVVWSRGNPDTTKGIVTAAGGVNNNTVADYNAYLKMGETWSVPSVGFVTAANYTTTRSGTNGTNFVLFTGSGYSDVAGEGKTFYVLDALNGDVIREIDVRDGSPAPETIPLSNFLVGSPVYIAEGPDGNSPAGFRFLGNPLAVKTKTVYFGDLHSRIFRFNATSPNSNPVTYSSGNAFFEADTAAVGNQPFATAVSVLHNRPDPAVPAEILVYAEAGHDRRVIPQAAKPFKVYAWKDADGVRTDVFEKNFGTDYRGTVQPATAFAGTTIPPAPVVFYAGVKFSTGACLSTFDSVLIALKGLASTPGVPEAAFELRATGDDSTIEFANSKINAIRVSGEGNLVIDQGLNAQNVPPPPGVAVPSETTSGSSSLVSVGLVAQSQAYKDLVATTLPYRTGSSVCRVQLAN